MAPLLGLSSSPRTLLLVYGALLASHGLLNHYGIRLVAWLNDFSVTVHIVGVIAIVGALMFFAPKQPLSFFFQRATGVHAPYWWSFLLGLLMAQWTLVGYDGSAHVSEETVDPRRRAPWGMVNAVIISAVTGYILLFALTLSVRNSPSALDGTDAAGNRVPAVIVIFSQALGSRAGSLMSWFAVMAMWFSGLACVTATSRTVYAFARDNGMPLSSLWRKVVDKHSTPGPAIWLCSGVAFLVAISSGAYSVITSMSTIGLYISYILPVYLGWRAFRARTWVERGPWNLARWKGPINIIAMGWTVFICVILVMPPNQVAGETLFASVILLTAWYTLSERKRFTGPSVAR